MTAEEKLEELTGLSIDDFNKSWGQNYSADEYNLIKKALDTGNPDEVVSAFNDIENARALQGGVMNESDMAIAQQGIAQAGLGTSQSGMQFIPSLDVEGNQNYDSEGNPVYIAYTSPLQNDIGALFTATTSPELVAAFQKAAEQAGLVDEDAFGEEDYFGPKTQSLIATIIEYGQQAYTIQPGTTEADAVIKQYAPNGFFGHPIDEDLGPKHELSTAIFMKAFDDLAAEYAAGKKKDEEEKDLETQQALAAQAGVQLSPVEVGDLLEDYYERNYMRPPSKEEMSRYYDYYGQMHSKRFKDLQAFYDANEAGEIFETYAAPYRGEFGGADVPQQRLIDFTVTNPKAELMQKVQEDTEGERALINQGNLQRQQTKELKKKMFSMVYG